MLQHSIQVADVAERIVQRFGARAAATLARASGLLKQFHPSDPEHLDASVLEQICAVMNVALAPLHAARQDAQHAINNYNELRQLARSCSI